MGPTSFFIFSIGPTYKNSNREWDPLNFYIFHGTHLYTYLILEWDPLRFLYFSMGPTYKDYYNGTIYFLYIFHGTHL